MDKCNEDGDPKLCENGCGFFGTRATRNLCSKCYKDFLKQQEHLIDPDTTTSVVDSAEKIIVPNTINNIDTPSILVKDTTKSNKGDIKSEGSSGKKRNRCKSCNKRVGLLGFGCSHCKGLYCGSHRYPEEHSCPFDFKEVGRVELAINNPLLKCDKLETRV